MFVDQKLINKNTKLVDFNYILHISFNFLFCQDREADFYNKQNFNNNTIFIIQYARGTSTMPDL